jgi:transposase-like protein
MGLSRRQFTKEFKLAAVRRLEQGISIAEVARGRLQFGRPSAPRVIARLPLDSASSIHPVASAYVRSLPMREYRFHLSREKICRIRRRDSIQVPAHTGVGRECFLEDPTRPLYSVFAGVTKDSRVAPLNEPGVK